MNLMPAASRPAVAGPDGFSVAVDGIVVGNLLSRGYIPQCPYQPASIHGLHIAVGVARMVDMALRRLHQHYRFPGKVVAMAWIFARREWMRFVHDSRIVDFKERIALPERPASKNTKSVDGRS